MARPSLPRRHVAVLAAALASVATAPATKPPAPVDGGWPRDRPTPAGPVTVYQPQLDSWDGHRLAVYAALAVREKPDSAPVFLRGRLGGRSHGR